MIKFITRTAFDPFIPHRSCAPRHSIAPVVRTASPAIKIALNNQYLTLRRINVLEGVSTMSMG